MKYYDYQLLGLLRLHWLWVLGATISGMAMGVMKAVSKEQWAVAGVGLSIFSS